MAKRKRAARKPAEESPAVEAVTEALPREPVAWLVNCQALGSQGIEIEAVSESEACDCYRSLCKGLDPEAVVSARRK